MPEQPPSLPHRRPLRGDPVFLLALALALAGLASAFVYGRRSAGLDFYQFWVVAQVAGRDDVPSIYDYDTRARVGAEFASRAATDEDSERRRAVAGKWQVLEPTATPLFYAAFRPLAGGTYERAYLVFSLLSLAALGGGLLLWSRLLGHEAPLALLALAFVALAFQPLRADVRVGNVNQLQLGAIAAYLWLSSRPDRSRLQLAAGALLALLVLFKPNLSPLVPLLFACWFWRARRPKLFLQAAGMGVGALVALAITLLVFGTLAIWPLWIDYVSALPPAKIPLSYGNVGFGRLIFEAVGEDVSALLAAATTAGALFCLWRSRHRAARAGSESRRVASPPNPRRAARAGSESHRVAPEGTVAEEWPSALVEDAAALAAGVLVYLLSAPIVWTHYFLLAVPAVLFLMRSQRSRAGGPGRRALAAACLLALAIDPWADPLGIGDLQQQAVVLALALSALFVLVCLEMASWRALPLVPAEATMPAEGEP